MKKLNLTDEQMKERKRDQSKARREKNRDLILSQKKESYARNKDATSERRKVKYQNSLEECRSKAKEYRLNNPDIIKAQDARRYGKHKTKISERASRYRETHKDQIARQKSRWHYNNKKKANEKSREWRVNNLDAKRVMNQNYRAKKKAGGGRLPRGIISKLRILQKNKCYCCSTDLVLAGCHIDHIQPLSKGGLHSGNNVQLLCPTCNAKKKDKDPFVFAQQLGRLFI